ncbi:MAG: aminoacyl-tRNA hydrolase [Cyanobacteria bacterium MAG CAR3_bin_5]|nr:aminoacyl-tRNA hydrolase [Cyanobacteria bacterium MAG CAR4_bin_6]MCY4173746.1 aminoacyl-tRNA hydrolase [Cyanobacteria bacterium MAG CAR3_bin_5]MCY4234978.1 aminoacyl-tRNA hydrolase [Cyanobacteria bacterium MAG CAR2_bin_4]MCY4332910.1 aminoacyl-tRNA hydrolase [Cyanobacteria bacterium MAG CAR1_bin_15]
MDLRLIAGLGNPGPRYAGTRHNAGFMVLEALASGQSQVVFRNQTRLKARLAEMGQGEQRLRLLMPQTYMNACGVSIRAALDWFRLGPEHLLVVVDDMDLPLGRLRLRGEGSAGGHKGLRSTIAHLNTQGFARLRVGIGAPGRDPAARKAATVGHVLGRFSGEEDPLLRQVLNEVVVGIHILQRQGLGAAMNALNGLRIQSNPDPGSITH